MAGRTEPTVRGAYLLIAFFADDLWGFMEHPSALRRPLLIVVPAALEVFRACLLPSPLFDVLPVFGWFAAVELFLSHGWFPLLEAIRADCFHLPSPLFVSSKKIRPVSRRTGRPTPAPGCRRPVDLRKNRCRVSWKQPPLGLIPLKPFFASVKVILINFVKFKVEAEIMADYGNTH